MANWKQILGGILEGGGAGLAAYGQGSYQRGQEQTDDAMRAYDRWIQQNPWRTGEETEAFLESLEQQYKHGDLQATGETARASVPGEEERLLGAAGTPQFAYMSPEMRGMVQRQVGLIDKPLAGPPRPPIQAKAAPGEIPAITTPYTTGPPSQFGGPSLQPVKPELAPTPYADKLAGMQESMIESQRAEQGFIREETLETEKQRLLMEHELTYGKDGTFYKQAEAESDALVAQFHKMNPLQREEEYERMREALNIQEKFDAENYEEQLRRHMRQKRKEMTLAEEFGTPMDSRVFINPDTLTPYLVYYDTTTGEYTQTAVPRDAQGNILQPWQDALSTYMNNLIQRVTNLETGQPPPEILTSDRVVTALGGGEQTGGGGGPEESFRRSGQWVTKGGEVEAPGMDDPRNPENQRNFTRINQLAQLIEATDDPMAIQQAVNEILEIDPGMTLPVTREAHSRLQPLPNPTDALAEVAQLDAEIARLQRLIDTGRISGEAVAQTKAEILELQRARLPFMVPTEPPR
jgi:hypothetical protein